MRNELNGVKAILFDLDGTIYLDGTLIGEADKNLDYLRGKNITVGYLTNNSSKTDDEYLSRFQSLNIWRDGDVFLSSLGAAAEYLKKNYKDKVVYPVATKACMKYLKKAGIIFPEKDKENNADVLLLTFDKELTYEKIVVANELLVKGATYIATHPDKVCPTANISIPDVASFMEMLYTSSGRKADIIIGKPYPYMAEMIGEKLGLKSQEILMVGDRLYTDIKFGVNAGLKTALVLSGESTMDDYIKSGLKVDVVIPDVNALKDFF